MSRLQEYLPQDEIPNLARLHLGPQPGEGATVQHATTDTQLEVTPPTSPTPKIKATFDSLPHELLTKILSYFLPRGSAVELRRPAYRDNEVLKRQFVVSRRNLRRVCLVCRRIRTVAQELLFHVVALRSLEDLLFFLRVLIYRVDLRYYVRTIIWAGDFSSARLQLDTSQFELAWRIYKELRDHAPEEDIRACALLDISSPYKLRGRPILGLVLAMVPRLRSLFLSIPGNSDPTRMMALSPMSPSFLSATLAAPEATSPHPVGTILACSPSPDPAAWAGPDGRPVYPFLQELETVVMQSHEGPNEWHQEDHTFWGKLLDAFSRSAPRLRRIELRHTVFQNTPLPWEHSNIYPAPSVKEFVLHTETTWPSDFTVKNLPHMCPRLTTLVLISATEESLESLAPLLQLRNTLESLTITTEPGEDWSRPDHETGLLEILPALTSLRHLTTEFVWLYRKTYPDEALKVYLPDHLPVSLRSLHLIDYWGDSDNETYYPVLETAFGPFGFMDQILFQIHRACNIAHVNLESIKVFSQCFDPIDHEAILQRASLFRDAHMRLFSQNITLDRLDGRKVVKFHAGGIHEGEKELRDAWARVV